MNREQLLHLAAAIGACRRAAEAAGHGIRAREIEILLLVAGGVDTKRAIAQATQGSAASVDRSIFFLSGRDRRYDAAGVPAVRSSPLRLIDQRQHPHQRGLQYRLTREGLGLLSPCLQLTQPTQTNA